jgi:hypothetical protein
MGLRDALQKLDDAVTDLTSLHVQTYSGTLNVDVDRDQDFDTLRKSLQNADAKESDINLVSESMLKFDGDSYNFVAEDAPPNLMQIHNEAVQSGLDARQSLIELFKDSIGV